MASKPPRTALARRALERPPPPWAPLPLTEVAIGVGLVLFVVGFARGPDRGAALIGAGVLVATLGVVELAAREHFTGFKSHVLLLAFLPVVAVHTAFYLASSGDFRGPLALVADGLLFGSLAVLLHLSYRSAASRR